MNQVDPLTERLRFAGVGVEVWRVMTPDGNWHCAEFSHDDSAFPAREANEWLSERQAKGWLDGYYVLHTQRISSTNKLCNEAADEIERLEALVEELRKRPKVVFVTRDSEFELNPRNVNVGWNVWQYLVKLQYENVEVMFNSATMESVEYITEKPTFSTLPQINNWQFSNEPTPPTPTDEHGTACKEA